MLSRRPIGPSLSGSDGGTGVCAGGQRGGADGSGPGGGIRRTPSWRHLRRQPGDAPLRLPGARGVPAGGLAGGSAPLQIGSIRTASRPSKSDRFRPHSTTYLALLGLLSYGAAWCEYLESCNRRGNT
eukprot:1177988-Prorocentrum_minimum.AAC.5